MSTSIILLDQNFNANDVDIMVFEPCVLFPPAAVGGELMTWSQNRYVHDDVTIKSHAITNEYTKVTRRN